MSNPGLETMTVSSEKQPAMCYDAPEVSDGKRELKSDVWSLGVTLSELAEIENPCEDIHMLETKRWVHARYSPSYSGKKVSALLVHFVRKCLIRDVSKRWSVRQLMEVSESEMM